MFSESKEVSFNFEAAEEVVKKLIEKNYYISCAESCTGGLLAAAIISVSDASKVLKESHITYWEEAKTKYANVSEDVIKKYGVVSEEVAKQMAEGVLKNAEANVGIGITGVCGPTGGTDITPIGTVCFGICINGNTQTFKCHFGNIGRNKVRTESVEFVLKKINELL